MHEMLGVAHKYTMYITYCTDCYEYSLVKDGILIMGIMNTEIVSWEVLFVCFA